MKTGYGQIYDVVREIPRGRVATYGQIAELAGIPGQPRRVGYALSALPRGTAVPWHRVINAQGRISFPAGSGPGKLQRRLLRQEGIVFDKSRRIDFARFRWEAR
jgi:methylated-DNA-protein-cysteine methyltransferase-like protein